MGLQALHDGLRLRPQLIHQIEAGQPATITTQPYARGARAIQVDAALRHRGHKTEAALSQGAGLVEHHMRHASQCLDRVRTHDHEAACQSLG